MGNAYEPSLHHYTDVGTPGYKGPTTQPSPDVPTFDPQENLRQARQLVLDAANLPPDSDATKPIRSYREIRGSLASFPTEELRELQRQASAIMEENEAAQAPITRSRTSSLRKTAPPTTPPKPDFERSQSLRSAQAQPKPPSNA